ncbi:UPF0192 protein [Nymphon striatum]|nr:UPF0192 protein [Nymphon striatum]
MTADGREVAIRLASGDEVNESTDIAARAERALPERWLAFRPVDPLPTDAAISITVGPNVPSAEGPETSSESTTFNGRTYGPLRITDTECGYGGGCQPGAPFEIRFSNPLDTELFSAEQVAVEPAIPGMQIGVNWNTITIQGLTAGRTDYDVTISGELTDIYGQQLGDDATERFRVGDSDPALFQPGRTLVTLDPIVDDGRLNVTSINNDTLRVVAYRVDPRTDWQEYQDRAWEVARREYRPDWELISERTIDVTAVPNTFAETAIDLTSELDGSTTMNGAIAPSPCGCRARDSGSTRSPITRTPVTWVTDLTTGEPIEGATVEIFGGNSGRTDADGIARLGLPNNSRGLLVSVDEETALIGEFWASRWNRSDDVRWYVIDDRGLYKPGETAHLKGWVRRADKDIPSQLSLPNNDNGTVTWTAQDAFGNEIGAGQVDLSAQGGFDLEIELPNDITLGSANVQFSTNAFSGTNNSGGWHELRVQEFRRPDFEVTATIADEGPYLAGDSFTVDAQADYFAGGPLASSPIDWNVNASTSSYSPPNWSDYTFGIWVPWWFSFNEFAFDDGFGRGGFGGGGFGGGVNESFSTTTEANGSHGLAVTVNTDGKTTPGHATVTDVTRQPITGTANALVHPADLYVGLKGDRTFVQAGERLDLDVIVTDIDGEAIAGRSVMVTSVRLNWQFENGTWAEVEVPDEACDVTSAAEAAVCTFRPSEGGRYRIAATVMDDQGRSNLTELTRWVAGGTRPQSRRVDLEELTLVPNGQDYQPGDTAEILVQSPFIDAHGLMIVTRGTIARTETFDFDGTGTAILQIPITSDDIPGIGVQFEVVGTAPRSANGEASASQVPRPAYAAGQLTLTVPADERKLTIDVAPRQDKA